MKSAPTSMTFFERFESDILSGKKVITIRDESEKDYVVGTEVEVSTYEDNRHFCRLAIDSVEPITFDDLNTYHAEQENMTLEELKNIIEEIYPNKGQLYVVSYHLA
ncbi:MULTISPECIES: N(4)-acetylcytidine aminohydrolase [unclassified Aliivibrio]|uniref:N(4)-acetylcytidine aminohydrolase n=1 Tax=unclassified Aliivibrio TaxID=2645654 RepID=UPI00080E8428|nr:MULTISPECIES: N(4)-acetylcytidine aminohydrolase [unclassified Aliivibrio]OCH15716.1 ASCH domain-containing protein [Aliivibrio sp. 1S128]OCH18320.1 ASCH domain-containing protein [Aliivibrio sp. 1S165]OCH35697.1 ASCH domain-containing protein [Aliivibrio sp. 1S175]